MAKAIATIAHRGQVDKAGVPYIEHPEAVAAAFNGLDNSAVLQTVAWLHDVLEDTELAVRDLLEAGVLPQVLEVVALLTRDAAVPDGEYYERIRTNPTALRVKAADIADNTAAWRIRLLDEPTRARLARKYEHARAELGLTGENLAAGEGVPYGATVRGRRRYEIGCLSRHFSADLRNVDAWLHTDVVAK